MKFEWDRNKAKANLQKHNVSFEEAAESESYMKLYKMQKLSMGKASELAEMNKIDFMFELGKYIPVINYDADDFQDEIAWIMKA